MRISSAKVGFWFPRELRTDGGRQREWALENLEDLDPREGRLMVV